MMADDLLSADTGTSSKKKSDKKTWVYIGLAGAGVVLTYLIYKHGQSSSSGTAVVSSGGGGASSGYQPGTELSAYQAGQQAQLSSDQGWLQTIGYGSGTIIGGSSGTSSNTSGSGSTSTSAPTQEAASSGSPSGLVNVGQLDPLWGQYVAPGEPSAVPLQSGTPVYYQNNQGQYVFGGTFDPTSQNPWYIQGWPSAQQFQQMGASANIYAPSSGLVPALQSAGG